MTATATGARRGARLEWAVALTAAAVSVAVMCWVGRDQWFRVDVWDFLSRSQEGSFTSWLRPHEGHLQLPAVALHRVLYAAFGMDFWPWYYLPHTLGYAGLVLFLWRVLLRRGADRILAGAACLVMLFLGAASFLSSVAVGSLVVVASLLLVVPRIDRDGSPSTGVLAVASAALVLMVSSSSLGVAAFAGCFVAAAVTRRLRRWWWCFLPAGAIYGAWHWAYGAAAGQGGIAWGSLPRVPARTVRLMGMAWQDLTGLPGPEVIWGMVVVLGLLAGFGWLLWRSRLRYWDWAFAFTAALYVLMVLLVRGGAGFSISQARYGYTLIVLAVPLVVPRLRLPAGWPSGLRVAGVALVGGALLAGNVSDWVGQTNEAERFFRQTRERVEAAAAVVAGGEPAIDGLRLAALGIPGTAGLEVADIRRLVADGWAPDARPEEVELMRVALRMRSTGLAPEVPGRPLALAGAGQDGCLPVAPGRLVTAEVIDGGWFTLSRAGGEGRGRVMITWRDRFGEFPVRVGFEVQRAVQLAAPVSESFLSIHNRSRETVTVCRLAEASQS